MSTGHHRTRWVPFLLVGVWALVVLATYYRRLWQLLGGDSAVLAALRSDGFLSPAFIMWVFIALILISVTLTIHIDNPLKSWALRRNPYMLLLSLGTISAVAFFVLLQVIAPALPFLNEALPRNLRAIVGSTEVFLAAFALGTYVRRIFGETFENRREEFLFTMGIGMGIISLVSLAMAAVGLYRPALVLWLMHLLAILAFVVLLQRWLMSRRQRRDRLPAEAKSALERTTQKEIAEPGVIAWKTIAALAAAIGLVGALAPETEYDALWYHLWLPKLWLQAGTPVDVVHEYISLYPLNLDLLFGAGLATGGPVAAKLVHYGCFVLTAMLVHLSVRTFTRSGLPWMAAALFLTTPTVLWEATTAYVDVGMAFICLLSIYALLRFVTSQNQKWLLLAATMAGVALGTKHLALLVVCAEVLGIALWARWQRIGTVKGLGLAVLFVVIAVALASPWYFRSYVASGNPFFPDLYSVFGAEPPERWSPITEQGLASFKARFGVERTPLNMMLLPWSVTMEGYRYLAAFGPLFLLLLPGFLLRRCRTLANIAMAFLIFVYVGLWASPLSSFQGRFLVPVVPLAAILAGSCFGEVVRTWSSTLARGLVIALMSGLMVLNLPPFISLHEADRNGWSGWLAHVMRQIPDEVVSGAISEEAYVGSRVRSYAAWQYVNRSLPFSARVLTFSGGDHFYSERERLWSESTMAFPAVRGTIGKGDSSAIDALRTLHITHILFDNARINEDRSAGLPIAQRYALETWCQPEYETTWFTLCRIRWDLMPK